MKFYSRKKQYKYGAGLVFFWKYKAKDGGWRQRQVYWGNRETDAIIGRYDCIKRIAQLWDGLERRDFIHRTLWLNRGIEDYSDEHFSESIYLRLQELKKQTPELPKPEYYHRPYRRRKKVAVLDANQAAKINLTTEQREKLREIVEAISTLRESFSKTEEKHGKQVIKRANQIREFGEKLEELTGKKRFWKRDFEKFRSSFPAGTTCKHCRLAISTSLAYPTPIENQFVAEEIVAKEIKLNNAEKYRREREAQECHAKALRQNAVAATLSQKTRPNLVPTIQASVNSEKSQFYWEFFK